MRKRKGYAAVTVDLGGTLGPTEVLSPTDAPHLGVIKAPPPSEGGDALSGWYWVYHLPSRRLACTVEGEESYLSLVAALGAVPGLELADPPQAVRDTALAVIQGWRPAGKQREAAGNVVKLEVAYNPGAMPSRAVRAADAGLASVLGRMMGGDPSVTQEEYDEVWAKARLAADLAWKETLVAAVNQVLVSGDELPERPAYLVDGTPCNWEGWKEEYKQLIRIGNDLQLVAFNMILLAELLEVGEVTTDLRREWRELDRAWLELIQQGWKHWGRAVSHYLASPPVRQKQVIDKLVYIGNAERGWGALGRITFLRHPEVAEASHARRMVQYARDERRGAKV